MVLKVQDEPRDDLYEPSSEKGTKSIIEYQGFTKGFQAKWSRKTEVKQKSQVIFFKKSWINLLIKTDLWNALLTFYVSCWNLWCFVLNKIQTFFESENLEQMIFFISFHSWLRAGSDVSKKVFPHCNISPCSFRSRSGNSISLNIWTQQAEIDFHIFASCFGKFSEWGEFPLTIRNRSYEVSENKFSRFSRRKNFTKEHKNS